MTLLSGIHVSPYRINSHPHKDIRTVDTIRALTTCVTEDVDGTGENSPAWRMMQMYVIELLYSSLIAHPFLLFARCIASRRRFNSSPPNTADTGKRLMLPTTLSYCSVRLWRFPKQAPSFFAHHKPMASSPSCLRSHLTHPRLRTTKCRTPLSCHLCPPLAICRSLSKMNIRLVLGLRFPVYVAPSVRGMAW